jgi:TonB-linked SusC/RagA family outer membrane protein
MLQMVPYIASAQQKTTGVTGVVQDSKGKAIAGVTVLAKNAKTNFSAGVQTDANGIFQFPKLPAGGPYSFTLSSVGYETQTLSGYTIKADALISLVAKMVENTTALEDVVVVGYGSRKKTDVTGAIASITGDKLRSVPTTNISTALQGRIAGIVVTPSSFRPGAGAAITVRGSRSLSAGNSPLYVVDGIPVSYTIDDISPNDIESIDVLKDASSTAIYGVRGANGVIQITTKKAKAGKTRVDYTGSTSYENILKNIPVFNAPQLADAWRQAFFADRQYNFAQNTTSPNNYFPSAAADAKLFGGFNGNAMWDFIKDAYQFTTFDRVNNVYVAVKRPTTAAEQALLASLGLPVLTEVDAYDASKVKGFDWQKAAIRQGVTTSHAISVSIGTDKIRSSFNGSYFKQNGIEYGQDYTRYSVGNNTEFRPTKYLTFGNNFTFTNSIQNVGTSLYGNASGMLPFTKPYDSAGNFDLYPNDDQQIVNGLGDASTVLNEVKVNRIIGNVFAELTLAKGLRYKTVFGIDYRNSRNGRFNGSQSSVRQGNLANASYQVLNGTSWTYDNMLLFDTKINKDHSLNITLLQELQSLNKTDALTLSANDLIFEQQKWYSLQQNSQAVVTGSGSYSAAQYLSYMGRLEYGYKGKYLLTVSNRYDNSSVLADGNQGAYFPSASFAWKIDNESFFRKQNIITSAKLRLGIGRVGNASIDPYQTGGPIQATNYNWLSGVAAIGQAPQTFKTPNLTWEKTTTRNLGLDFSLLQNKVNVSIDLYSTTTKDILQRQTINATNGVGFVFVNRGKTENKGIDISISSLNVSTKQGFTWSTDLIFSKNVEKLVDIDGSGNSNLPNLWILNQPSSVYYSYVSDGIYQYGDTAKGGYLKDYLWNKGTNAANTAYRPGRVRVRDINGDTLIDANDKRVLGSHNPDWTANITNTFNYKNFELSISIYVRQGGLYRVPRPGLVGRYQSNAVNYWTPSNPSNEYQQPTRTTDIPLFWEALTYRDASFAKVRNISLTYKVSEKWLAKIKANSMAFYVNAINPFLIHKHSDYDPETIPYTESFISTTGNPGPNSYSFRSFVIGLRLGF